MATEWLEPDIRRIVAPNPSPMTARGTCAYILGTGAVAVIDPGPDDPAQTEALLSALLPGERVAAILVTHAHADHSPGARPLARATGAPVYAFGPATAGRSATMERLARAGFANDDDSVDRAFRPDVLLADGESLEGGDWSVRALHTPGHFGNHLSFQSGDRLFTGDVAMGWSTTVISPPDGDLRDYFASLEKLRAAKARILFPGHGEAVSAPETRLAELAAHRRLRTTQILTELAHGPARLPALTERVYLNLPPFLLPAAQRNVFAHLIALHEESRIVATPDLAPDALFRRI